MPATDHDVYKPAEIAALIETAGVAEAALRLYKVTELLIGLPPCESSVNSSTIRIRFASRGRNRLASKAYSVHKLACVPKKIRREDPEKTQ